VLCAFDPEQDPILNHARMGSMPECLLHVNEHITLLVLTGKRMLQQACDSLLMYRAHFWC